MRWSDEDTKPKDIIESQSIYDADVIDAEDFTSKKGNECINLKLKIYGEGGETTTMYSTITAAYYPNLRGFCMSAGLYENLIEQDLRASDCLEKSVKIMTTTEKNKSGYFDVEQFVYGDAGEAEYIEEKNKRSETVPSDDDIPF